MVHLVYYHQGHKALPSYGESLARILTPIIDPEAEVWIAQANPTRDSTIWGLDTPAARVVTELQGLLGSRPEVTALSLVGVSLGGLILERAVQILDSREAFPEGVELRTFIAFATPFKGLKTGWNLATFMALLLATKSTTVGDLLALRGQPRRQSVRGLARFELRVCLANVEGDWRVPLETALPVGGSWPWSCGTRVIRQSALDGSSVAWYAIVLDLTDTENPKGVHHAIVEDPRVFNAIRSVLQL